MMDRDKITSEMDELESITGIDAVEFLEDLNHLLDKDKEISEELMLATISYMMFQKTHKVPSDEILTNIHTFLYRETRY